MHTSHEWYQYFSHNLQVQRINWEQSPQLNTRELETILPSLQAWQLGETSDGKNLLNACTRYAHTIDDPFYVKAMELFIKEEQKHGNNLGKYLDMAGQLRIQKNWGDSLFRWVRHLNTSMESWTIAVITVENSAQIFYQALKDATGCPLLKQICTDILIDEAPHIQFQQQRLTMIFQLKGKFSKALSFFCYKYFYIGTTLLIWMTHKKLFKAGGNSFRKYYHKMMFRFQKTVGRLVHKPGKTYLIQHCRVV